MRRVQTQLLWSGVLFASLLLAGCSGSGTGDTATLELGDAIVREVGELRGLLGLNSLIFSGIGLALVWVTLRGIRRAVHVVWRLGLDSSRRLETTATAIRVALVALVVLFVLRRIASLAPVLLTFTLLAAVLLLGAAYARQLPSVLVGLSLLLRRRLRHGDRIHIANHSGTVREVGLAQLHLRRGDGATLFVPNRLLMEEVLTVEHAKNSEPVRVRIPSAAPQHRDQLELARRVALLSPYRVPGSPVELIEDDVENRRYCIEIHTWSVRAATEAREHLEQTLDSALAAQARARE
ncbi:MAG: mechanosensitive ion channel [Polyangiaceae bacterium]|nr:mechanosensitive ion channel [Myxococcales bacterium]MCB9587418.1 mechanosensitive ion channel [Polyangiaceae bacterium]MCB9605785.1 mechanosensitive ion channel [Polyangiaceae bacterium]